MIDFIQFACGVWVGVIWGPQAYLGLKTEGDGDSALTDDRSDFGGVL